MALVAQTAACNSLHNIEERLARWILLTQDRVQRPEMPLTHEFLSYMLGVRRASVSMAAAQLAQKGLIHYTRGSIRILDRERLEGHACTCYTIVREITDRIFSTEAA